MFCDKCGTQLPDTASFCNKCGNTIKKREDVVQYSAPKMDNKKQKTGGKKGVIIGILIVAVLLIAGMAVMILSKNKPSIYGVWTDENETIVLTFEENGTLNVAGQNNVLGADMFQFTEGEGCIYIKMEGTKVDMASVKMEYELIDNTMIVNFMDYSITLYRVEDPDMSAEELFNMYKEQMMNTVQGVSLHGTWTDGSGMVSFTFYEDGKIRIAGLEDTLGVELLTYTEVDQDTLKLKADTKNVILGSASLNMDYEITDDIMTVSIAGQSFQLIKQN